MYYSYMICNENHINAYTATCMQEKLCKEVIQLSLMLHVNVHNYTTTIITIVACYLSAGSLLASLSLNFESFPL